MGFTASNGVILYRIGEHKSFAGPFVSEFGGCRVGGDSGFQEFVRCSMICFRIRAEPTTAAYHPGHPHLSLCFLERIFFGCVDDAEDFFLWNGICWSDHYPRMMHCGMRQ